MKRLGGIRQSVQQIASSVGLYDLDAVRICVELRYGYIIQAWDDSRGGVRQLDAPSWRAVG